MNLMIDREIIRLMAGLFGFLLIATGVGGVLKRRLTAPEQVKVVANLNARIRAWWVMCVVFVLALLSGGIGSVLLFTLISFMALREYITLTPTKRSDHRALFWTFFIILPFHYIYLGIQWYGMFSIFIPVYAFIFLPIRNVIAATL